MSVAVPTTRGIPDPTDVVIGAPVAAPRQWTDAAYTALWLKGKGAQLIPCCAPNELAPDDVAELIYRFRVKPRTAAIQRVWVVSVHVQTGGEFAASSMIVRVPATTGDPLNASVTQIGGGYTQAVYVETLSAKSATTVDLTIGIALANYADNLYVIDQIACYEQDRPLLTADTTDNPVLTETVRPNEPIGVDARVSAGGVLATLDAADARRVGIYHWARAVAITRLSATPADLLTLPAYIQAPKAYRADTTHAVRWAVYARMSASGGSGTVAISTSVSGASDSVAVTANTFGWIDGGTVNISCDDFTEDDGAADDQLAITIAGDGTRSIEILSLSMWVESLA